MGDRINYGGTYNEIRGSHHTVSTTGGSDPHRVLAAAIAELDRHLSEPERGQLAAATHRLESEQQGSAGWRAALRDLAGIAVTVGQVGAPVIEAVRRLLAAVTG